MKLTMRFFLLSLFLFPGTSRAATLVVFKACTVQDGLCLSNQEDGAAQCPSGACDFNHDKTICGCVSADGSPGTVCGEDFDLVDIPEVPPVPPPPPAPERTPIPPESPTPTPTPMPMP